MATKDDILNRLKGKQVSQSVMPEEDEERAAPVAVSPDVFQSKLKRKQPTFAPRGNDADVWSPAELTYGQQLRLPGDFQPPKSPFFPITSFGRELQRSMTYLKAPPSAKTPSSRTSYVPPALKTAEQVYVRIDKHTGPLHRPYAGPYNVIDRTPKYFTIAMNGKHDTVSIDRLKPVIQTRSGRIVVPTT